VARASQHIFFLDTIDIAWLFYRWQLRQTTKEATMEKNSIKVTKVGGFQKKNPTKTWEGLAVNVVCDGLKYSGIIFAERQQSGEEVKF
jgi:hypothetical protein